jgi:hypothetical protein
VGGRRFAAAPHRLAAHGTAATQSLIPEPIPRCEPSPAPSCDQHVPNRGDRIWRPQIWALRPRRGRFRGRKLTSAGALVLSEPRRAPSRRHTRVPAPSATTARQTAHGKRSHTRRVVVQAHRERAAGADHSENSSTRPASQDIALAVAAVFGSEPHRIAYRSALDHHGLRSHPARTIQVERHAASNSSGLADDVYRRSTSQPRRSQSEARERAPAHACPASSVRYPRAPHAPRSSADGPSCRAHSPKLGSSRRS